MNKLRRDQNGLTLIEVLAVLVIGGIILAFSTSLIVQAMNNQERITIESQLRDEADIIMAHLTKAIFTLKESEIIKIDCQTEADPANPALCSTDNKTNDEETLVLAACKSPELPDNFAIIKVRLEENLNGEITKKPCFDQIGFKKSTVYAIDEQYELSNDHITLEKNYSLQYVEQLYKKDGSTVPNAERVSIKISFTLTHKVKNTSRTFQNEIVTVDNI